MEPKDPIPLRYIDLTIPGNQSVSLTLYPGDTVETMAGPSRLVVRLKEKSDETFTVYLGPGVTIRESVGMLNPIPLDENGDPRQFDSLEEYRAYLALMGRA